MHKKVHTLQKNMQAGVTIFRKEEESGVGREA